MNSLKSVLFVFSVIWASPAFANSYACITSSVAPSVAYCYEDSFDTVDGVKIPSPATRIETIKGDSIVPYLTTDLQRHFLEWTNVKNSGVEEVNRPGKMDFNVSVAGKTVLTAPYIAPRDLKPASVVLNQEGMMFDGLPAPHLVYSYGGKD